MLKESTLRNQQDFKVVYNKGQSKVSRYIIIVTGKQKRAIEDHFDRNVELEVELENKGKLELLEKVKYPTTLANIHYVRQKEMATVMAIVRSPSKFSVVRAAIAQGRREAFPQYTDSGADAQRLNDALPTKAKDYLKIEESTN